MISIQNRTGAARQRAFCRLVIAGIAAVLGACLLSASFELPASAQATTATNPPTSTNGLEEIVVTARRREEKLQTVPIAITVVGAQALQDNNIQTLGDLQYLVPSLSAGSGLDRNQLGVSIRGQGTNYANGVASLPAVVSYLNEVPIPNVGPYLAGGPGLLFDLENVQVLKGPQGTLFGRNSVGGDLLLQSARPTDEFGGHMQATYGNFNDREFDGAINIPVVSDILRVRLAVNGQVRDGFTFLQGDPTHPNGIDADDSDHWSGRATVTFRPSDRLQNDTIITYSNYESHGSPLILTNLNPNGLPGLGGAPISFFFPKFPALFAQQQALGIRSALPIDTPIASSGSFLMGSDILRIEVADGLTFRNIASFAEAYTTYALDGDGTALPLANAVAESQVTPVRQYTEEPQLLGKSFGGQLDWIVGAFFLDQPTQGPVVTVQTIFGGTAVSTSEAGDWSRALFAQGTYDLSSFVQGLKLTGGARYTWDTFFGANCGPPAQNCISGYTHDKAPTWTGTLDYQIVPNTLLYVTSRRGYRGGGSNEGIAGNPAFGPEYTEDYELGIKSDWMMGSIPVRTNADVYYQNYTDIQVAQITTINDEPVAITNNAAAARITGAEFEATLELTPALQVGATFDYLDFAYKDFGASVNASQQTQLLNTRTENAPPRKYGVNARYHLPLPGELGDVSWRANWNWQARSGDFGQPGGDIPAFGLLNMNLDWNAVAGAPIDVSLFASNLLNKDYSVGGIPLYYLLGYSLQRFGEPRMYGIRLNYRFGGAGKH
jgi:iron complex outermembrane receptor protein